MEKYKNKYRIKSIRAEWWNYGNNGFYFITICTKNRHHSFGKIKNEIMCLNEIGSLAYQFWNEIPQHFPSINLDAFIIMPDHMHGILIKNDLGIDQEQTDQDPEYLDLDQEQTDQDPDFLDLDQEQTLQCNVSTGPGSRPPIPTHKPKNFQMAKISPKPGSISTIIRSYKSAVSKHARKINSNFAWHTSYYDHIIRNERAYNNIHNYINNNPANWGKPKRKNINRRA